MARLSICLFGPFRVTVDGEPATAFESDKVRALLAYLAVEAEVPHRREKLAGLLWPDWPERAARANLSRALTNLRHSIGDRDATSPILFASRQAIQFNRAGGAWVDVTAFQDLTGLRDLSDLTQAVDLYRGPFLEGFSLSGCPEFEEWVLFEGERFQRLALQALDQLSESYEKEGELEPALQHAWRQVELAPWQESAHQQVMRLLARTGQRGAAIAHYETCRQCLADELGVEPSTETVALYEQIRQETLAPRPSPTPMHNLRAPLTPFVGREAELAELGERLSDPACRLLTLVGPGGIGKTRLAVEAARAHMDRFPQGVFQVRLAGVQSAESILPTIAESIGFSFNRQGDAKQQLLDYLSNKTMLLVLDNFEHLLAGLEIVIDLLQAAPAVTLVVTSRMRLSLQGEHLFPVDGMAVPPLEVEGAPFGTGPGPSPARERGELGNVAEYDAVKLFMSGAHRACPGFRLADQAAQVSRICRLVDGMPLAILLASSRVGTLAPAEIAARIAQDLDLLEADWRDVPQRHRSVRAAFDHSWKLLTEREQEVFGALSVFRGGFDQEAAQAVSGATIGDLWGLVDKSFLHRLPMGHYEVHELLRQYGSDRLRRAETPAGAPAPWEAAHERHCGYYTAALQRWAEELKGARQQAALAQMDLEVENARAAWSWAAEQRQVARLEQALEGLCLFYGWRARYQEGETACRLAVERLARKTLDPSLSVLIKLLAWQGAFNRLLERSDPAAQLFAESQDLLAHPALAGRDLRWERAFLLFQKAHMMLHSNREEAGRLHGQSAALFCATGNDWWAATALREQGRAAFYRGLYAEARRLMEQSLAVRRAAGDQRGIAESLDGLGILAMFQGEFEKAVETLQESAAILGGTGCRYDYASALGNLGISLATAGKLDEGHAALEQSIATFADIGRSWALAHDMAMLGIVKMWLGRYDQALAQSDRANTLSQQTGYWRGSGLACWVRSGVALARGAYTQAQQWSEECATLSRRIEQRDELAWALGLLGSAARGLGQLSAARQHLREAISMAAETESFAAIIGALPMIPPLLADQGQGERAVELYALVLSQIPIVPHSRWFEDIAGRHIAAVAGGLPPDVVAAAQARGRARDLWATVAELVDELAG